MVRPRTMSYRFRLSPFPSLALLIVFLAVTSTEKIGAQQSKSSNEEGYVTALQPNGAFDINQTHVFTSSRTRYGLIGSGIQEGSHLRDRVQVGAYVEVHGASMIMRPGTVYASEVLLSEAWDRKYAGTALIEKLTGNDPEFVVQADGFRIRITASTKTDFDGNLRSMADVGPGLWVHYEGKIDSQGLLVAAHARFESPRTADLKAAFDEEAAHLNLVLPDLDAGKDGGVNIGLGHGRHAIPADRKLQERVARVGMSVVPAYQKAMADDKPGKIPFRFFAIDGESLHADHFAYRGGLILVPRTIVERLISDDQLAAVLADGVAYSLEEQGLKLKDHKLRISKQEAVWDAAMIGFSPLGGTAGAYSKLETEWEQQRGRVALSLLAEAGYDPWQAPEAWRMLGPKHLPTDAKPIDYPDRAGYQLSILNLAYRR